MQHQETPMTKTTNESIPAETDDARSAETPAAKENRDALAGKAEQGLREAMKEMADNPREKD
jgi:hypothetical protein